jgi:hypothetical protein
VLSDGTKVATIDSVGSQANRPHLTRGQKMFLKGWCRLGQNAGSDAPANGPGVIAVADHVLVLAQPQNKRDFPTTPNARWT